MGTGGVDFDDIMDAARDQGMVIERTSQGHYRVKRADGAGQTIHCSRSDDTHARMNILRDLKGIGLVWPPPRVKRRGGGASSKDEVCCLKCFNIGGTCRNVACECHVPQLTRLDAILAAQGGSPPAAPSRPSKRIDDEILAAQHGLQAAPSRPGKHVDAPAPAIRERQNAEVHWKQPLPSSDPPPDGDMQLLAMELVDCKAAYQLQREHEAALMKKLTEIEREVAEAAAATASAWARLAAVKRKFDEILLHDVEVPPEVKVP